MSDPWSYYPGYEPNSSNASGNGNGNGGGNGNGNGGGNGNGNGHGGGNNGNGHGNQPPAVTPEPSFVGALIVGTLLAGAGLVRWRKARIARLSR